MIEMIKKMYIAYNILRKCIAVQNVSSCTIFITLSLFISSTSSEYILVLRKDVNIIEKIKGIGKHYIYQNVTKY